MSRAAFLKQEIDEGLFRVPPMPQVQWAAHVRELNLIQHPQTETTPKVDLKYIQQLGHVVGCHLYDTDGHNLAA